MDAVKLLAGLLGNNASSGNLLGKILQQAAAGGSGGQQSGGGNPLAGVLGGILGSAGGGSEATTGGANDLLGAILGAATRSNAAGGGANDLLGSILGAATGGAAGSAAGGLLGSILGAASGGSQATEPSQPEPGPQQPNDTATILIRAMCNAAKSDGEVDKAEQQNIIGRMGDLDQAEVDFLRKELSSPLNLQEFVNSVPRELAPQVYGLSCMTVKIDTMKEARYLGDLAEGLRLDDNTVNQIHEQLGIS